MTLEANWEQFRDKRWILKLEPENVRYLCKLSFEVEYWQNGDIENTLLEKKLRGKYLAVDISIN